ncbi:PA0069 family radical SAM protein [Pleionea litopenaei]|uniref:PA0069 family radical SAM protein n=1 Tax=Pleionea litopenaei TaxID=3070815 RepID=A0AA51RUV1_9GAMM|nr:PA0069 family radical SAM protein [Pleionea sp. HL-JVS1]WMS88017.1 PA0069 family radical SAM protein [Pleionea sp. HL-JVS1]
MASLSVTSSVTSSLTRSVTSSANRSANKNAPKYDGNASQGLIFTTGERETDQMFMEEPEAFKLTTLPFKTKSRAVATNYRHRFTKQFSTSALADDSLSDITSDAKPKNYRHLNLEQFALIDELETHQSSSLNAANKSLYNPTTEFIEEHCKTIISTNQSPDVPFERSINPYRGCEHGCVYCFARPSHAYLDYSPGLDFETKIVFRANAVEQLAREFEKQNYTVKPIALGMNTDAYQPIERDKQITRQLLQLCLDYKHPVTLLTKSNLVLRDLDILQELAKFNLVHVGVSITTLDHRLKNSLEPRASSGSVRLKILEKLVQNRIPCFAMIAPIIPALNDCEIEKLLQAIAATGTRHANYIMLRLPYELKDIFSDWLTDNYPYKKTKVLAYLKDIRDGSLNQSSFGERMRGSGALAQIISARFKLACKSLNLNEVPQPSLNCNAFTTKQPQQLRLI